jgi:hypothetical protein
MLNYERKAFLFDKTKSSLSKGNQWLLGRGLPTLSFLSTMSSLLCFRCNDSHAYMLRIMFAFLCRFYKMELIEKAERFTRSVISSKDANACMRARWYLFIYLYFF